jgi:hypothetical protein
MLTVTRLSPAAFQQMAVGGQGKVQRLARWRAHARQLLDQLNDPPP